MACIQGADDAQRGDIASLRDVYPALRRHLLWTEQHVYYIMPGHYDFFNDRDADFVSELLVDMAYAKQIATALGVEADQSFWEQERQVLFQHYVDWFWAMPDSVPQEYFPHTSLEPGMRAPHCGQ